MNHSVSDENDNLIARFEHEKHAEAFVKFLMDDHMDPLMLAFLKEIALHGANGARSLDLMSPTREKDRARQKCRRQKLVYYEKGRWFLTENRRMAL